MGNGKEYRNRSILLIPCAFTNLLQIKESLKNPRPAEIPATLIVVQMGSANIKTLNINPVNT